MADISYLSGDDENLLLTLVCKGEVCFASSKSQTSSCLILIPGCLSTNENITSLVSSQHPVKSSDFRNGGGLKQSIPALVKIASRMLRVFNFVTDVKYCNETSVKKLLLRDKWLSFLKFEIGPTPSSLSGVSSRFNFSKFLRFPRTSNEESTPVTYVAFTSIAFSEGIMAMYEIARSSIGVEDNDIVSSFGTCPARIPTPADVTLVLLRFKVSKFAPTDAINSTESSPIKFPLRSKFSRAFMDSKKDRSRREEFDKSKKDRQMGSKYEKAFVTSLNEVPERINFFNVALLSLSLNPPLKMECIVQLLMFRHVMEGKFGNTVTFVHARFRKFRFGNLTRIDAPSFVTSLPHISRCCKFVKT